MSILALARRLRARRSDSLGFTLIELMMAVVVFSIFLVIVTTSIIALTRGASRIQVAAVSTSQELAVFARLDKQIRYADGVNAQGAGASGDIYFEFRIPSDSSANNLITCTQWRYDPVGATIAVRQWTDGNLSSATAWSVLLTNVANDGGANYPFAYVPTSTSGSTLEEMTLTLDAGNTVVKGAAVSSTFVARNSLVTASNPGGAICPAAGSRP